MSKNPSDLPSREEIYKHVDAFFSLTSGLTNTAIVCGVRVSKIRNFLETCESDWYSGAEAKTRCSVYCGFDEFVDMICRHFELVLCFDFLLKSNPQIEITIDSDRMLTYVLSSFESFVVDNTSLPRYLIRKEDNDHRFATFDDFRQSITY